LTESKIMMPAYHFCCNFVNISIEGWKMYNVHFFSYIYTSDWIYILNSIPR
jgi:hypothetical protein